MLQNRWNYLLIIDIRSKTATKKGNYRKKNPFHFKLFIEVFRNQPENERQSSLSLYYNRFMGSGKSRLPGLSFSPEVEKLSIQLAALDIMKQLCQAGLITKEELRYIAEIRNLYIE